MTHRCPRRPSSAISAFLAALARSALFAPLLAPLLVCMGCRMGVDVADFIERGMSIVEVESSVCAQGDHEVAYVASGKSATVKMKIRNPSALELRCTVTCADESLFESLPEVSVPNPSTASFAFTPSLRAERRGLVFTAVPSSPETGKTYAPETIVVRCDTPPGGVAESLDAALDENGFAFAAFKLPSSPTDDDLAQVRISYAAVDGSGTGATVVLAVDDGGLRAPVSTALGIDLLGPADPLNRYFRPSGIGSGDDYLFTVALIDTEGLESEAAEITTDAARYAVTYDGNGHTAGSVPTDPQTYRHTKSVTVLGAGTLTRSGYTFAGWNDKANGEGTSYAPGSVFKMGPGDLKLYAHWVQNGTIQVGFVLNPTYKSITFSSSAVTVARGTSVELTASDPAVVADAVGWRWYVGNAEQTGQTTSTFTWNTTGVQPGQYGINAEAEYGGLSCTGSIRVTVTY